MEKKKNTEEHSSAQLTNPECTAPPGRDVRANRMVKSVLERIDYWKLIDTGPDECGMLTLSGLYLEMYRLEVELESVGRE